MESSRRLSSRRSSRFSDDPLERRLDQWLATGRQLVDGVSGARPGRRVPSGRSGASAGARLDAVGRWMGDKLDWLLDEEDDWREPWEADRTAGFEQPRAPRRVDRAPLGRAPQAGSMARDPLTTSGKQPLEAISRRQPPQIAPARQASMQPPEPALSDDEWPDDDSFRLDRWQRQPAVRSSSERPSPAARNPSAFGAARRPLPRSSRRRD